MTDTPKPDIDFGEYDGTDCPVCGRQRVLAFSDGSRRCEKCEAEVSPAVRTPKPDTSDEAVEALCGYMDHHSDPSYTPGKPFGDAAVVATLRQLRKELTEANGRALQSELYANSCAAELKEVQSQLTEAREKQQERDLELLAFGRCRGTLEYADISDAEMLDAFNATQKEQSR